MRSDPPSERADVRGARTTACADDAARAGLLALIYAISYGGAAVPSLIAGQLARTLSVFQIALGYGAVAALACIITLAAAQNPLRSAA
jgi:hypothetical protein